MTPNVELKDPNPKTTHLPTYSFFTYLNIQFHVISDAGVHVITIINEY